MRVIILITAVMLASCISSKPTATNNQTLTSLESVSIPAPNQIHGIGFARLSNYNQERSFQEAKRNAITDLESSLLTSVYLEYYGDNTISSKLRAEYGIADDLQSHEYTVLDSLAVGDWAIYFLSDPSIKERFPLTLIAKAQNLNWTDALFEPQIVDGFWIASGYHEQTQFNPDRGWTKAKQHALKNLSEYLNTKVQSLQRTYNNDFSSVHYVTSKHVFNSIGVIDRAHIGKNYHVLIMIRESDIIRVDEPPKSQ
ncbi:MAG: hypothetical protein JJ895_00435 [Balneolaceae bacterium]|nr:hypothetical protein [Balneolaceae bacterium]